MANVKLAIIYYSSTGTNYQTAMAMKNAAEAADADVRFRKVAETAPDAAIDSNPAWRAHVDATQDVAIASVDDLVWADAILMGGPTRFGNVAAQLKQFIDITGGAWFQGQLANKVVSSFTSSQNLHGGQEVTLLALQTSFYHWGCFIVPPGYTDDSIFAAGGNPYGFSTNGLGEGESLSDQQQAAAAYQARRVVQVAGWIKAGQAS